MTKLLWMLVALACAAAHAADERARIAAERQQAQKTYDEQYNACQSQFAVTACVDRAKAQRRTVLEQLTQQQAVLDDAERKQRAAQRAREIHEKMEQSQAAQQRASAPEVTVKAPRVNRAASAPPPTRAPSPGPSMGLTEAQRARNRADYDQRQSEAATHREEVERRVRERAAHQDKPITSLPERPPIPPSAASR